MTLLKTINLLTNMREIDQTVFENFNLLMGGV